MANYWKKHEIDSCITQLNRLKFMPMPEAANYIAHFNLQSATENPKL